MRSIERRFNGLMLRRSGWSTYTCFAEVVRGCGFNRDRLHHWFGRLVDTVDYDKADTKEILGFLDRLTKPAEA